MADDEGSAIRREVLLGAGTAVILTAIALISWAFGHDGYARASASLAIASVVMAPIIGRKRSGW